MERSPFFIRTYDENSEKALLESKCAERKREREKMDEYH